MTRNKHVRTTAKTAIAVAAGTTIACLALAAIIAPPTADTTNTATATQQATTNTATQQAATDSRTAMDNFREAICPETEQDTYAAQITTKYGASEGTAINTVLAACQDAISIEDFQYSVAYAYEHNGQPTTAQAERITRKEQQIPRDVDANVQAYGQYGYSELVALYQSRYVQAQADYGPITSIFAVGVGAGTGEGYIEYRLDHITPDLEAITDSQAGSELDSKPSQAATPTAESTQEPQDDADGDSMAYRRSLSLWVEELSDATTATEVEALTACVAEQADISEDARATIAEGDTDADLSLNDTEALQDAVDDCQASTLHARG